MGSDAKPQIAMTAAAAGKTARKPKKATPAEISPSFASKLRCHRRLAVWMIGLERLNIGAFRMNLAGGQAAY